MKRFLLAAAFFAVLVLLWEAAYRTKIWSPVLLPSPKQVVNVLGERCCRWNPVQSDGGNNAPLGGRLLDWTRDGYFLLGS